MSMSDTWLLERAHGKKKRDAQSTRVQGAALMAGKPVGSLWRKLQKETVRQAAVYCKALGRPNEVVVETPADEIQVKMRDGRQVTTRIDRKTAELSQTIRSPQGAVRMGRPVV